MIGAALLGLALICVAASAYILGTGTPAAVMAWAAAAMILAICAVAI